MKYAGEIYGCPEQDVEGRQLEFLARSGKKAVPHQDEHQPIPRLEWGRWICDCPCGSGAGITKKGIAHCFECGRVMQVASWPNAAKRAKVEKALKDKKEQHWKIDDPEPQA